ncbi:MAG: HAMP domain-containing sensor histidine kinase, partial [Planctomycetota bacterium]
KTAQRFVENVSHDFRSPLTVIMEYAALISDEIAGPINSEQRNLLGIIDDRAADLNNMVDDMLDASKLESGMLGASRSRASIREIIDRTLASIERKAEVREVNLHVDFPEIVPPVFCDEEKVERVMINLASNAIKFTPHGGNVTLRVRRSGVDEVLVDVEDDGIGIPKAKLDEISERFSQVKSWNVGCGSKGFGLGLSIAQELVNINLGQMHVESEDGKGSTFGFTLPIDDPEVVTRKFLNRLRAVESAPFLSLFQVQVPAYAAPSDADEVRQFLTYFLRQNDLLLPHQADSMLMLVSASTMQMHTFLERLADERERLNRNRPRGPLPEFDVQCIHSQPLDADDEVIISAVRWNSLESEELTHATC